MGQGVNDFREPVDEDGTDDTFEDLDQNLVDAGPGDSITEIGVTTRASGSSALTGFEDMARTVENLPFLVEATRRRTRDSVEDVALLTGLSKSTVSRLERGLVVRYTAVPVLMRYCGDLLDRRALDERR